MDQNTVPSLNSMLLTLILFLITVRLLYYLPVTSGKFLGRTFLLLFVISVMFSWLEMYEKGVADQERIYTKNTEMKFCQEQGGIKKGLWQSMKTYVASAFTFGNKKDEKCKEYYYKLFVNPITSVSPMEAVAMAVVKTIVAPSAIVGSSLSTFITEVLKDMPIHFQPVIFLSGILLSIVSMLILKGYKLNIFHLIIVEPSVCRHVNICPPLTHKLKID